MKVPHAPAALATLSPLERARVSAMAARLFEAAVCRSPVLSPALIQRAAVAAWISAFIFHHPTTIALVTDQLANAKPLRPANARRSRKQSP